MTKVKLSTVLTELFERAGAGEFQELEELKGIGEIEVPEKVSNALLTGLLSKARSRNDIDLQKHYVGKFLVGTLENAKKTLKDKGLTDEEISFIDDQDIKFKEKQDMIIEAVSKKSAPTGKGDNKALQDEIATLNSQIADYKKNFIPKADYEKHIADTNQKLYQNAINGLASKIKWSDQEAAKSEALRLAQFNTALQIELQEAGAVAILDENNQIVLRKAEDNSMVYFDKQNKSPNIETFINELALKNKFISVSGGDNTNPALGGDNKQIIPIQGGDSNNKLTPLQQKIASKLDALG